MDPTITFQGSPRIRLSVLEELEQKLHFHHVGMGTVLIQATIFLIWHILDTGCKNSFGHAVPCFQEGEARKKRSADEEAAEAAPAVATVLPYGLGLGYHGLGYAGLGYAGLHYPYAVPPLPLLRLRC